MSLSDTLVGLLPLIILIAAVLLLVPGMMRRMTGPGSPTAQSLALMERQVHALERIAVALEKRRLQ
jgi:hypothetical protein